MCPLRAQDLPGLHDPGLGRLPVPGVRPGGQQGRPAGPHRVRRPGDHDPGWVSKVLIGINVVAFVLQQSVAGFTTRFFDIGLAFDPVRHEPIGVADGEYYRLLTSAFLHENVLHIALNMYALYLFGPPVEAALGRVRFTALYLVSARRQRPVLRLRQPDQPSLGASGAVFGLLGASWWSIAGWGGTPPR